MEKKELKRYTFIFIFIILLVLSFLIIRNYITVLLASMVFAYMFYPVYKWIAGRTNNIFAAFLTIFIILLILILPLVFIANALIEESIILYHSGILQNVSEFVNDILVKYVGTQVGAEEYFSRIVQSGIDFVRNISLDFVITLPSKILDFFIFIFSLFYLLVYGRSYLEKFKGFILLKERDILIKHIGDNVYSIVYGTFLLAIIEFLIVVAGFFILGIRAPVVWGVVTAFLVFIPLLGPSLVWVPFTLLKLYEGSYNVAIGLLVLGLVLSYIDTFVRAKILADRSKINPIIILLGVLGGISLFGIIGAIIGPVILSLFIEVGHLYTSKWNSK